jgi:hypothetical protein
MAEKKKTQRIPKIHLEFDPEYFPVITKQYSMARLPEVLANMCLKNKMEITETNLYSVAASLESDLAMMFPEKARTPEEQARYEAEEAEAERVEEEYYQRAIKEMKPYMEDGIQMRMDEDGILSETEGFLAWVTKGGAIQARVSMSGGGYEWRKAWIPKVDEDDEE